MTSTSLSCGSIRSPSTSGTRSRSAARCSSRSRRRLGANCLAAEASARYWTGWSWGCGPATARCWFLRGEPGVGKTTLLEYLLEGSSGCRIARAAGVEPETELAFAGLHQLCAPFLDRLERLPGPQREALCTAFGLRDGAAPDRFLVGLAVMALLSGLAQQRPLVCAVDDAQWLDRASAQTLAFVARRLADEPIAIVFVARQPAGDDDLTGLPELVVPGLGDGDARALLDSVVTGPLDEQVRDRIVAETRGNPLALLELPCGLTPEQLAGGFGLLDTPALSGQMEASFRQRLASLPPATRMLLLVAATEPVLDPVLVWRAAGLLGVGADAAAPAAAAGLLESGGQVRFCHPLARSAVYRAASPQERQTAHGALAQAADPELNPDRRAWHRGHATAGLDEDVAAELGRSAGRARARGGLAAAAAFQQLAAELTPDPAHRGHRAVTAAQAKRQVGAGDVALQLLTLAQAGPLDELQRARAEQLRAQIAVDSGRGRDAPPKLLEAAKRLEALDPGLSRETYRDAFSAALAAGRLEGGCVVRAVAQAARRAPAAPEPYRAADLLLEGLGRLITDGYAAGAPVLRRALSELRERELSTDEGARWLPLACRMAREVWDDESWSELSTRLVELAQDAGALTVLPTGLLWGVVLAVVVGDLPRARSMAEQAQRVADTTGRRVGPYGSLAVAAWEEAGSRRHPADRGVDRRDDRAWRRAVVDRRRLGERGALQRPVPV